MLASGTIARYHGYVVITLGYSLEYRGKRLYRGSGFQDHDRYMLTTRLVQ